MTSRRLFSILLLVAVATPLVSATPTASEGGTLGEPEADVPAFPIGQHTCLGINLDLPVDDHRDATDCSEAAAAILFDGVVREGEALTRTLLRVSKITIVTSGLHLGFSPEELNDFRPFGNTVVVTTHTVWDPDCANSRGEYAIELNEKTLKRAEAPGLVDLCRASSSDEAITAAYATILADVERVQRDAPALGALVQPLVDGLPEPGDVSAPVDPQESVPSIEEDTRSEYESDPEEGPTVRNEASADVGDVHVETGEVEASPLADDAPPAAPAPAPAPPPRAPAPAAPHVAASARPPPRASAAEPLLAQPVPAPVLRSAPPERLATVAAAQPQSPVASQATAAAAASGVAGAAIALAAFALYQRLGRHVALAHPTRAALHQAAIAMGAGTAGALAVAAGIERRSVDYHLRYLVRAGILLAHERPDAPTLYAAPGARKPETPQEPLAARLLDTLRARPGRSTLELAREAGVGYGRVDRRLKDLLREGAVESRVEAGERRYFAAVA